MKRLIALLLIGLLLTGCAKSQPQETAPTEAELVYQQSKYTFGEPHGAAYGSQTNWWAESEDITYSFVGLAPREKWDGIWNEVVEETKAVLLSLESRFGEIQEKRTVCTLFVPYAPRVNGSVLYIGRDRFQTLEYAIGLAQLAYGNEVNYGLLYALGTEIAQERGYPIEDAIPMEEALTICETAPVYLDMNYACFLENYADEETLTKVRTIAREFFASLSDNEKADLLSDYSDEKYCHYLNIFLNEKGKPAYDNSDLGGTRFFNGGEGNRLVWENEDAAFYVDVDYQEQILHENIEKDILNSSYVQLRQLIVDYRMQASYFRDKFEGYATEKRKPDVLFRKEISEKYGANGLFIPVDNEIILAAHAPFAHEYIHYLTQDMADSGEDGWRWEMLAYYHSFVPGNPRLSYGWADDKMYLQSLNGAATTDANNYAILTAAREHLEHPLDLDSAEDYFYLNDVTAVARDRFDAVENNRAGSIYKISFFCYLNSRYGEEAAMKAIYENSPKETLASSWEALEADWEETLKSQYPWAMDILAK